MSFWSEGPFAPPLRQPPVGFTIGRASAWRFPTAGLGAVSGFHEWAHFCVASPKVHLIVNISLAADPAEGGARVIVLVHTATEGVWHGVVEPFHGHEVELWPGRLDSRFGPNELRAAGQKLRLRIAPRSGTMSASLELVAESRPISKLNASIPSGEMSWLAVPRMSAAGWLRIGATSIDLAEALAYHDHNWGRWRWGADFGWNWGFVFPADRKLPWVLVLERLTNRARTEDSGLRVYLWRGEHLERVFREEEASLCSSGLLRPASVPKFPPVMGLLVPEASTDVPATIEVLANTAHDRLRARLKALTVAQVLVPSTAAEGVTIINEILVSARVDGLIGCDEVHFDGTGVFEHLSS